MKRLNNKGFTVVEIIITFAIVMSISVGLLGIVDNYRTRQQKELYLKELNSYKNEILRIVYNDIYSLGIESITGIDVTVPEESSTDIDVDVIEENNECKNYNQGVNIEFAKKDEKGENISKLFCVGDSGIRYGDNLYKQPEKVKFTNDIIYLDSGNIDNKKNNKKILSIRVKMTHPELKEPIELNIVGINKIEGETSSESETE